MRARLTTQSLMILVVLVALGMGAFQFAADLPRASALFVFAMALILAAALRITERQLVTAVVVVLVVIMIVVGVIRLRERAHDFQMLANMYGRESVSVAGMATDTQAIIQRATAEIQSIENSGLPIRPNLEVPDDQLTYAEWVLRNQRKAVADNAKLVASYRKLAAYHAALQRKYQRAANYPWLSVPPDPTPPLEPK